MTFSEMPYERPDTAHIKETLLALAERIRTATDAAAQIAAFEEAQTVSEHCQTMAELAMIRHTINTKDAFYDAENAFMDENGPLIDEAEQEVEKAMLASPFRAALEAHFGELLFTNLTISVRSFSPDMVELMQEENRLQTAYQKLYASAMVTFDGKTMPLPLLGPYKTSPDRAVRREAFTVEGWFFDEHREELDSLFDKLVHNRNAQAKLLGYENYIPLGYDRLGRNAYTSREVAQFRDQIARDVVPAVNRVKACQQRRIGTDRITIYDNTFLFPDGNACPQGTPAEILAAGKRMYTEMSPQTAEFIQFMYDNELLDVLSKDGKAPGGYCTEIPDYRAPFIFSNFNGTSGDVDVLTHEAGHAFAAYRAFGKGYPRLLRSPTMEACEVHSMSMEFLTAPWHRLFFGDATEKYELYHCEDAFDFIPYGCMVDEFQHRMYEQPDLTPEQRNGVWLALEKKYRPYLSFDNLPFYSRGAGWQRQLHIYLYPLYYIDYCMAQTVAFQFYMASLKNRDDAWKRYTAFVDLAGTKPFDALVKAAGLLVPYEPGSMKMVADDVSAWIVENQP